MVENHATDALRLLQAIYSAMSENFGKLPDSGRYSIDGLAKLLKVSDQCVRDHLSDNEILCILAPGGWVIDLEIFWKSLPLVPYGKKPKPKDEKNGKAKSQARQRRGNNLPDA